MRSRLRWAVTLAPMALVAGVLVLGQGRRPFDPLDEVETKFESVIVLDGPVVKVYRLRPPFRLIRGGGVVLNRRDVDVSDGPIVRIDLTVAGEPLTVFARTTPAPARVTPAPEP